MSDAKEELMPIDKAIKVVLAAATAFAEVHCDKTKTKQYKLLLEAIETVQGLLEE